MKTAILIIGNVRTWKTCKDNFKESFGHLDPDVFVSTYDLQYGYHPAVQSSIGDSSDNILSTDEIRNLFSDINVVDLTIENSKNANNHYNEVEYALHPNFRNHPHTYLQYRKLRLATLAMEKAEQEKSIVYDTVIKIRADICHFKFDCNVQDNQAIVSYGNVYPNDVIFATKRDSFVKLTKFFMSEFYKPLYEESHLKPPHNLLLCGFNYCGLEVRQENLMQYVVRKTGNQYY